MALAITILCTEAYRSHLRQIRINHISNPNATILQLLREEQRMEFIELIKSNQELKKGEARKRLNDFLTTLPPKLQV